MSKDGPASLIIVGNIPLLGMDRSAVVYSFNEFNWDPLEKNIVGSQCRLISTEYHHWCKFSPNREEWCILFLDIHWEEKCHRSAREGRLHANLRRVVASGSESGQQGQVTQEPRAVPGLTHFKKMLVHVCGYVYVSYLLVANSWVFFLLIFVLFCTCKWRSTEGSDVC